MKRSNEFQDDRKTPKITSDSNPTQIEHVDDEMGEFEDPYGDDFESEDEVFEADENGLPDEEDEQDQPAPQGKVYLPHRAQPLGENEVMEPDYSTYNMLHSINVKWPCLSFDIMPDKQGQDRTTYPQTMYVVTGTQAEKPKDNEIQVLKFSQLGKTLVKDEDEESDDDDSYDTDPILETRVLPTNSTTNRIRVSPFASQTGEYLTASLMEDGNVQIWDLSPQFASLEKPATIPKAQQKPIFTIKAHGNVEGYAVDWNPLAKSGQLLTGDISGKIFLTERTTSGWATEKQHFSNPTGSIEELQWSPAEKTVFASTGSDGYVRIWDCRQPRNKAALSVKASDVDVNVLSWNKKASHLLASGHDDGKWGVWDLRTFTSGEPVAAFNFHKKAVTSIEFHPTDESVVAVASEDNTVSLWDLSVEADDEEVAQQTKDANGDLDGVPSQLLFVHWQPAVKEVHWHKQIPGTLASTGYEGFTLWNTISI